MGYDLSLTRAPIEPIRKVMAACRGSGYPVIHTREGHRPDLSDLPANKLWRSERIGAGIGTKGPAGKVLVRGEPGWELIPELAAAPGEVVIDKPGKGSFCATDLDLILRTQGIRNIVLAGITTDVCVSTTMREANDMGYECLLLTDCTAATEPANRDAIFSMVKKQGGVFGAVASSEAFIAAIGSSSPPSLINGTTDVEATVPTAAPYPYSFPVHKTGLVMIDFQRDFIYEGGFGAALGNDVGLLKASLPGAARLLAACRGAGIKVIHTLEAHKPDLSGTLQGTAFLLFVFVTTETEVKWKKTTPPMQLTPPPYTHVPTDLPESKLKRGNPPVGMRIGDKGDMGRILVAGEDGNGIVDEVAPIPGEKLVWKPGKGAFYATDFQDYLQANGITHLLFAGVTTEVCVQTTMREANDRGYECLLVTDATDSYITEFKQNTIDMITAQGGIVGWTATSEEIEAALKGAPPPVVVANGSAGAAPGSE